MATKRLPRPRDPIALAKPIGQIATGQVVDAMEDMVRILEKWEAEKAAR